MTNTAIDDNRERSVAAHLPVAWVLSITAAVFAIHWPTTASLVRQWELSPTHSHGFLVVPVFAWLVWRQREALGRLSARPFWPGALGLAVLGVAWLVGEATATKGLMQLAIVAMVPAAVGTLLGARWLRVLAFPMFFLIFAVPMGDSLVPVLIDWTADFTVAALKLSGIPVYRDGTHFSTPSGDWSIVDSCSGIRYVFACAAVSSLFAWLEYRSLTRRTVFVAVALCVAVVANWVRAYAIVLLAHLTSNRIAVGADHLIYGAVFLAVVLTLTMLAGRAWREAPARADDAPRSDQGRSQAGYAWQSAVPAAALVFALVGAWPLGIEFTVKGATPALDPIAAIEPRGGWVRVDTPATSWRPQWHNPLQTTTQAFERDGHRVTVHLALFGRPTPESKLTSSSNRLIAVDDAPWTLVKRGESTLRHRGEDVLLATGVLAGPAERLAVCHWYWVDGARTTSAAVAAARQFLARLGRHSERSGWIALATPDDGQLDGLATLQSFLTDMLDSAEAVLDSAREPPRP